MGAVETLYRLVEIASALDAERMALDEQPEPLDVDDVMRELHGRQTFYFTSLMRLTGQHPLMAIVSVISGTRFASVASDAEDYFIQLLETNSSRASTDIVERLHATRVSLRQFMRRRLFDLTSDARKALDHARQIQRQGELAVRDELARLDGFAQELQRLRG